MSTNNKSRVAILHYAGPPGVGGVESVIQHHAHGLAHAGYPVRIVAGSGAIFDDSIEVVIDAHLSSTHPDVLAVKRELDAGDVSTRFEALCDQIYGILLTSLAGGDVVIAHNVAGLHKNLALTAALHRFTQEQNLRLIHWYHDLAWTNPQYQSELHDGFPWDLLRSHWSAAQTVTISADRRSYLARLLHISPQEIHIVPGGIDPPRFLRLTPLVAQLSKRLHWFEADALLLYPTRLTRRKNVELALDILAALRGQTGLDIRLLVTGPPGPHNPANTRYLNALHEQRQSLGLTDKAHLLYSEGDDPSVPLLLTDDDIGSLYALADALLFTSTQEGFGIPILEAGLSGLPIFCSDLPPLREIAGENATYFDPVSDTPDDIARRLWSAIVESQRHHLRTRVRKQYTWDSIINQQLIPLIEGHA